MHLTSSILLIHPSSHCSRHLQPPLHLFFLPFLPYYHIFSPSPFNPLLIISSGMTPLSCLHASLASYVASSSLLKIKLDITVIPIGLVHLQSYLLHDIVLQLYWQLSRKFAVQFDKMCQSPWFFASYSVSMFMLSIHHASLSLVALHCCDHSPDIFNKALGVQGVRKSN